MLSTAKQYIKKLHLLRWRTELFTLRHSRRLWIFGFYPMGILIFFWALAYMSPIVALTLLFIPNAASIYQAIESVGGVAGVVILYSLASVMICMMFVFYAIYLFSYFPVLFAFVFQRHKTLDAKEAKLESSIAATSPQ